MRTKILNSHQYRGYEIDHIEEDAFRGATSRNPSGWSKKRFYWVRGMDDSDHKTLREVKAYIDQKGSR